jgi:ABC-type sugar transport systems, ATPase components
MAISSHIAVIDQGILQQYAPPDELYLHPKNLFVASFIGNPPMNFIDGAVRRSGDVYECATAGGTLLIPGEKIDPDLLTSDNVILGIRPHNFRLVDDPRGALTLHTDYIEHLGKENLYRCYMEDEKLRVITPVSENRSTSDALYVCPDYDFISVFDKETGNIISR